jgi:hypothetical protein
MAGGNNMFDWFKKKPKAAEEPKSTVAPKKKLTKEVPKAAEKSPKQLATEKGEPYVAVLGMDVDPDNLHQGAFELDWNDIFVNRLVKAGYMIKKEDTDAEIVDRNGNLGARASNQELWHLGQDHRHWWW